MNWLLIIAAITFPDLVTGTQDHVLSWQTARVDIQGSGPNGTDKTGPIIRFGYGVRDGIDLGAGDPYRATGSRIERVRVVRLGTGGTAIKIVATSKECRPGEIVVRDVMACGMSDLQGGITLDNWDTALLIDGSDEPELIKSGTAGVRRIRIDHFRAASCIGDAIVFKNVTHLTGTDIQVDRGTSNRVPTMIVEDSRHVFLYGLNIFGELHLRGCNNVRVDGFVKVLRIDSECRDVIVTAFVEQHDIKSPVKNRINVNGMVVVGK